MVWTSTGSILLTSDWQYTEPIPSGSFFRLKYTEAPNGGLFAIAQCEVDTEGKLSLIDSQVLAVEKPISDVLRFALPGCFGERRIAIKKLSKQPTLQEELRRLILPGFLQPNDDEIRIVSRSKWTVDIEVSDFVEPSVSVDLTPIETKLDAINSKIDNLQQSGSTGGNASNTKTLTYASDGDTNGVCYWIGTNYGAEAWTNPHTAGRVVISKSSDVEAQFNFVERLVDRTNNAVGTNNAINSWMKIDLGATNKLAVNYYLLKGRTDQFNDNHLQTWKLQGSNDDITWADIDSQTNNPVTPSNWKSIPVAGQTNNYRYLKILITGVTSNNAYFLVLGEWEFYGTLAKA